MYAEIRFELRDSLANDVQPQAAAYFSPVAAADSALSKSVFRDTPDLLSSVIVAKLPPSRVIVIFRDSATVLKVHVEFASAKPNLSFLREIAEEAAADVGRFLATHGMKVASHKIRVYVEGDYLETGAKASWGSRLFASARKEIAGRLAVPAATFLVSLAVDSDVKRATANALAAFLGVIVWLLLTTTLEKSGYRYE
jgi:hypothetical protein